MRRKKTSVKYSKILNFGPSPVTMAFFTSKYVGDFHRGTGFVCFDGFLIMKVLILLKFPF